jgi:methylenetetrahydrofolate reductase (NADPH)
MTVPVSPKRTALLAAARERILVLDGAMGTMIQGLQYDEAAFRGERFKDFHRDVRGNNDLLILTQPKAIEDIHADYLRAGADIVDRYHDVGVRHIVALRGDPPGGIGTAYSTHPDGYKTSAELVAGIKKQHGDIEISVSAYPEKHPESSDIDADIDMLKAKVDAGATRAITQVFFDNDLYLRYLDRVRARGIDIPIVPGIMPMHNFKQARGFVTRAGTTVPSWLADKFEGLDDDAETRKLVAATVAAGQVQKLAKHGVDTFHFYTMNRADLVFAISHLLGIRPNGAQKAA